MKPVEQTAVGVPAGNCFEACLASILEIPLESIPHFVGDDWWERYLEHFGARGVELLYVPLGGGVPKGYSAAGGPSPRHAGVMHSVVCLDGEMVWDPHPRRDIERMGPVVDYVVAVRKGEPPPEPLGGSHG